jgi:hypothetical protein
VLDSVLLPPRRQARTRRRGSWRPSGVDQVEGGRLGGASRLFGYWSGPRAFCSAASSTTTPTPSGCATPMRSAGSPEARTCDVDHLRPVTGGTYGSRCGRLRSLASSREVPAETQEGPAGTGRGWGTQRKDRCSGSGDLRRWLPGTGGSDLAAGGAGQGRGRPRPVGISDQARSVTGRRVQGPGYGRGG